jgi:hypothetical protein
MLLLTFLFIVLAVLVVSEFVKSRYRTVLYISVGVILFLVAGFRPPGFDRDYLSYLKIFNGDYDTDLPVSEPSILLIISFIQQVLFSKSIFLFLVYAALGISLKMYAIRQLSEFWFASLLVYFSYSFLLHDLTQIRAGVAVGFILVSIKPLYERRGWQFLIFTLLAASFHYSALAFLPAWFLSANTISKKIYTIMIFATYLIYPFSESIITGFLTLLPNGVLLSNLNRYQNDMNTPLNIYNIWQLMRCALCIVFLWKSDLIKKHNRYAFLLIKLYAFATFVFVLLASNPAFAGRFSDIFSIVDIIVIPCLIYIIQPPQLGAFAVVVVAFLYFFLNVFFNSIFYG